MGWGWIKRYGEQNEGKDGEKGMEKRDGKRAPAGRGGGDGLPGTSLAKRGEKRWRGKKKKKRKIMKKKKRKNIKKGGWWQSSPRAAGGSAGAPTRR